MKQAWPSYLAMTALVLALLLPLVSIMTLTSEWGQRSVLVTFTQEPRRQRVVAAKVLSGLALALLGAAFAFAISAAAMAGSDLLGRSVDWSVDVEVRHRVHAVRDREQPDGDGLRCAAAEHAGRDRAVPGAAHAVDAALLRLAEDLGRWLDTAQTYRYILESDWDGHTGPILVSSRCGSCSRSHSAPCAPCAVRSPDPRAASGARSAALRAMGLLTDLTRMGSCRAAAPGHRIGEESSRAEEEIEMNEDSVGRRHLLRGAGVAAGGVALSGVALASPASAGEGHEHRDLSGSWRVNVHNDNGDESVSILSFAAGDVCIVHDISPAGPPFTGTWRPGRHGSFRATVLTGTPDGVVIEIKLRGRARHHEIRGSFTFSATDPSGNEVDSGTGTFDGQPVEA